MTGAGSVVATVKGGQSGPVQTAGALLKLHQAAHVIPEQKQGLFFKGVENSPAVILDPANRFGYKAGEHVGVILLANGVGGVNAVEPLDHGPASRGIRAKPDQFCNDQGRIVLALAGALFELTGLV